VTTTSTPTTPTPADATRSGAAPLPPLGADSVRAVTRVLDGRWGWVRERSRAEALDVITPMPPGLPVEEQRDEVLTRLRQLAAGGYSAFGYPREIGGGGDLGGSVTAFEMLGFGELSLMVKAGVQWGLFGGAIEALGTARHHQEYLPRVMSGELLGCFGMTETGHGSDVQSVQTVADYDPATEEFVVHTPVLQARKDYIGNAARDGRIAVVFCQLVTGGESRGVHAVLVPLRDGTGTVLPGVTIEDDGVKEGLNGVDNGRISFDHVRVPRANLLDRYAQVGADGTYVSGIENANRRFFTMLGTLVRGRISVAGAAGSATKAALTIAVRYGDTRRQFESPNRPEGDREVPVLDYLAHQRLLLPLLAKSYALHFAQGDLVSDLHDLQADHPPAPESTSASQPGAPAPPAPQRPADEDERDLAQRELEARAAGLKAIGTWHAVRAIQACREACGGAGYLAENRLPQLRADVDVFATFEGANTVLLQLVAKGLATEYKDHLGDLDSFGMVRFLADQVVDAVLERTKVRRVAERIRTDENDLLDRAWQLDLLRDREEHVLDTAARRLRRATGDRAFEVFNAAQDHVLLTASTHIDRLLLESFAAGIERCTDPAAKALLNQVCDLFALSTIEADRAWFLEHDRLTTTSTRAVTRAVNDLCRRLRPHAVSLVDAFAIPDQLLASKLLSRTDGGTPTG
jgi:acyl-CoA oxidase